jgi:hypothetical protein
LNRVLSIPPVSVSLAGCRILNLWMVTLSDWGSTRIERVETSPGALSGFGEQHVECPVAWGWISVDLRQELTVQETCCRNRQ